MSLVSTINVGVDVTVKIELITGSTVTTSAEYVNTLVSMAVVSDSVRVVSKRQLVFDRPTKVIVVDTDGDIM